MIYRSNLHDNYTIVNNIFLRNEKLSWKAKGLLAYLVSLPKDWKISIEDLKNRSKDQRDATRTAMIELIDHGYCYYKKIKNETGQWLRGDYYVSDEPIFAGITSVNPLVDNPIVENPLLENPILLNTILNKYFNIENTNNIEQQKLFEIDSIVKPQKEKKQTNGATTFMNSDISALEKFKESMDDEIFIGVNLEYYYNLIKNWSVNRGGRKPDWVAFCKNWIMQDVANKKAIMQSSFISNTQYIKGYE